MVKPPRSPAATTGTTGEVDKTVVDNVATKIETTTKGRMIIGVGQVLVAITVVMVVAAEGAVAADNSGKWSMGIPKIIVMKKRIRIGRSGKSSNTLLLKSSQARTPTSNRIRPYRIASPQCRHSEEVAAANVASRTSSAMVVVTKMMPASKKR